MKNRKRTWMDNFVDKGFQPFVLESSGRLGRSASLFVVIMPLCVLASYNNVSTYMSQESGDKIGSS
jgi:hypothetical protein